MPGVDSECVTHHICACNEARLKTLESHCTQMQVIIADLTCRCGYMLPSRDAIDPRLHHEWCSYRKAMEHIGWPEEKITPA